MYHGILRPDLCFIFFFQAEDGIRDLVRSRGLGDVYKRQAYPTPTKANIKLAFEAIKKEAKAADILLVYFSGHGIAKGDEFYYLSLIHI